MNNQHKIEAISHIKALLVTMADRNLELYEELETELENLAYEIKNPETISPCPWTLINSYVMDNTGMCVAELPASRHTSANGRLIVAAPEMLYLLESLINDDYEFVPSFEREVKAVLQKVMG